MVLNELADLMTDAVPQLRQVADNLMVESQSSEQEVFFRKKCDCKLLD